MFRQLGLAQLRSQSVALVFVVGLDDEVASELVVTSDILEHLILSPFAIRRDRVLKRSEATAKGGGFVLVRFQPLPVPHVGDDFCEIIAAPNLLHPRGQEHVGAAPAHAHIFLRIFR